MKLNEIDNFNPVTLIDKSKNPDNIVILSSQQNPNKKQQRHFYMLKKMKEKDKGDYCDISA